nr:universal stress protein [Desulfosporosinus sp. I2]
MGAKKLGILKRLVFGCLAQSVLNKSAIPVLIIK